MLFTLHPKSLTRYNIIFSNFLVAHHQWRIIAETSGWWPTTEDSWEGCQTSLHEILSTEQETRKPYIIHTVA